MRGIFPSGFPIRPAVLFGAVALAVAGLPGFAAGQSFCTGCNNNPAPTGAQVVDAASGQTAMPGAGVGAIAHFSDIVGSRQDRTGQSATGGSAIGYAQETPRSRTEAVFSAMAQAPWDPVWSIWAQGYHSRNFVGDAAGLPGYNNGAGGIVAGIDRQVSAELLYGFALGYSRTTTNGAAMRGTSDATSAAVYATWMPGAWQIEGRVGAGYVYSSSARSVPFAGAATTADGSAGAYDFLANVEAGYRVQLRQVVVKPYAGFAVQTLMRNSFTETGPFGVLFPNQQFTKAVSTLGVSASTTIQTANGILFAPEVKLAWAHDLRDDTLTTRAMFGGLPYIINAPPPGPDAAIVSAALTAATSDVQTFTVSYSGDFRANAQTHLVSAGLRRQW